MAIPVARALGKPRFCHSRYFRVLVAIAVGVIRGIAAPRPCDEAAPAKHRFVIADLKPTLDDLAAWRALDPERPG